MAVKRSTSFADSTAVTASAAPGRLLSVRLVLNPSQASAIFLQLFDSTSATPGVTTPDYVIKLPNPTGAAGGLTKIEYKIVLGNVRFATGIQFFVSTTYNGATAVITTSLPQEVQVFYGVGN